MNLLSRIIVVCLMVVSAGLTAAESATGEKKAVELKTEESKVSYIIGTQMAGSLARIPAEVFAVDKEALIAGIIDILEGKEPAVPAQEQQALMMAFQQKMMEAQQKEQEKMQKEQEAQMEKAGWKTKLEKPEMMEFDANTDYFWVLETSKGKIKIKLMPEVAPMHVTSTIFLTEKGFYNDLIFHRVIKDFMAQGGCPLGTGTGGPGYKYAGEFKDNVKHDKPYLLSMANAGPGTDGSQFFITFKPTPWLDGKHTIFGEVVEGQKVVDAIEAVETTGAQNSTPVEEIKIIKATIEEVKK